MIDLEELKKEIEQLRELDIEIEKKAHKSSSTIDEKMGKYNKLWIKQNKKTFPFKIGDFICEFDNLDTPHKIIKIDYNFRKDRVILETLMIISDSLFDIEIRTSSKRIMITYSLYTTWEQALIDEEVKTYDERNYKTRLLDFIFDIKKVKKCII